MPSHRADLLTAVGLQKIKPLLNHAHRFRSPTHLPSPLPPHHHGLLPQSIADNATGEMMETPTTLGEPLTVRMPGQVSTGLWGRCGTPPIPW